MSKIAKNYILNLAYEIFGMIVPLITAPYLTRVLKASQYGIYSYVNSVTSIILTICLMGVYAYGNRQTAYCRDDKEELSATFWELMTLRVFLGVIGTVVYFIASAQTGYFHYFILYYAFFLSNILDCSWIFVGMENMFPCVIKNFVAKVLTLIGVFVFIKTPNDVGKYIFLTAISSLGVNLAVYVQLKNIIKKPHINVKKIFIHLKGSFFLFLPQVASMLYLQMDKVMLEWLTDETSQVSFYDQAEKMIMIPLSFITALSTVMMPRIANEFKKGYQEGVSRYIIKAGVFSLALACPLTVGIAVIAVWFVPWYLGDEYIATAYAMIILSPIVISNSLVGISGKQYFTATNRIGVLTISNIFAALMNLIVNAILIPKIGYVGAAIATLLSSYTCVIFQYSIMRKDFPMKVLGVCLVKYMLVSMIMGIVVLIVSYGLKLISSPVTTMIQIICGALVFMTILLLIKDKIVVEIFKRVKSVLTKLF